MNESVRNYENDGFRGRVALRMLREGAFDMRWWSPEQATEEGCGTACCLAGNILLEAGYSADHVLHNWSKFGSISNTAAAVWAGHYGKESADKLDFYGAGTDKEEMADITPQEAVDHIYSI